MYDSCGHFLVFRMYGSGGLFLVIVYWRLRPMQIIYSHISFFYSIWYSPRKYSINSCLFLKTVYKPIDVLCFKVAILTSCYVSVFTVWNFCNLHQASAVKLTFEVLKLKKGPCPSLLVKKPHLHIMSNSFIIITLQLCTLPGFWSSPAILLLGLICSCCIFVT